MDTSTRFREYNPDQLMLLPPDLRDWLPKGHCAYFILDLIPELDLSSIYGAYDGSRGGQPPYDPRMMVGLLLYAYCEGVTSSRRIERATYDSVAYRVLSVDQHPDHDTISWFRQRHLEALSGLFTQVLRLCRKAGLVKLGHVALDGTKIQGNASKHKAMSYSRMQRKRSELEAEVKRLLAEAEATDAAEDALYGKGNRGDELPEELQYRKSRLEKIRAAMAELEVEAAAEYPKKKAEYEEKVKNRKRRGGRGRKPKPPSKKPDPKQQRNFTDKDSRIMVSGDAFVQAYNCQAAVDGKAQIIIAADVTQDANDKQQIDPMVEQIKANTSGEKPNRLTADSGYFTEDNIEVLEKEEIDAYIATEKQKHGDAPTPCPRGRIPKNATIKQRMARKLQTIKGRATYSKRKETAEPVFGQIKECRGFRRFSFRGLPKVKNEWALVCLTHNIRKLFKSGWVPNPA